MHLLFIGTCSLLLLLCACSLYLLVFSVLFCLLFVFLAADPLEWCKSP